MVVVVLVRVEKCGEAWSGEGRGRWACAHRRWRGHRTSDRFSVANKKCIPLPWEGLFSGVFYLAIFRGGSGDRTGDMFLVSVSRHVWNFCRHFRDRLSVVGGSGGWEGMERKR